MGDVVPFTGQKAVEQKEGERISLMGKDDILIRFEDVRDDLVRNKLPATVKDFFDKFEAFGSIIGEPRFVCARSLGIYKDKASPIVANVEYLFCYLNEHLTIKEMIVTITVYRLSKLDIERRKRMHQQPDFSGAAKHRIRNRVIATIYQYALGEGAKPILIEHNKDAIVVFVDGQDESGKGDTHFYMDITEESL